MKLRLIILLAFLANTACHVGPRIDEFEQARRPEGVPTTVRLHYGYLEGGELSGELLEVTNDGLLLAIPDMRTGLMTGKQLVFVPYAAMIDIDVDELGLKFLSETDSKPKRVRHQEELRLMSRFPQGLSAQLLERLLAAEGQSTVRVIGIE